jgi:hypothetical protein
MGKNYLIKREFGVGIAALLLLLAFIPFVNAYNFDEITTVALSNKSINTTDSLDKVKESVDNYFAMDENLYEVNEADTEADRTPQPKLGGNEAFGLWIRIVYNDKEFLEKIDINPQLIRGKLSDPKYRTPVKFNVDDDPGYDIETGFGFFEYGIDEIQEDGTYINHDAWATAFDFYQIDSLLKNQLGEIEIWQEFHVNLALIKNKHGPKNIQVTNSKVQSKLSTTLISFKRIIEHFENRLQIISQTPFKHLYTIVNTLYNYMYIKSSITKPSETQIQPLAADEDYIVTRVGYRSEEGQKIPLKFEKTFAMDRGSIFRPSVFQHEMNPYDIIGTASNDVMFAFQAYGAGNNSPSYDVEFDVNFEPAVYTITQFVPRTGRVIYYYHDVGAGDPLDITFSSNLLKGGDPDEEKEGTLSLSLTVDTPHEVTGSGKWMLFDPKIIGDHEPIGGKFVYAASHNFDVGFTVNSPRFEEKVEIRGIPKSAIFSWGIDTEIDIVKGKLIKVEVEGFADLTMSSPLSEIIVYYPKAEPDTPDITCMHVCNIPSSRELRTGASLNINKGSMLKMDIGGFVQHDISSQLGDITLYWPKADPYDPDAVFIQVPGKSFSNSGRTSALATLYVDPDDFSNPNNYIYANVERTASSDFGEINFYLPDVDIPIVKVYDVPGDAYARGRFEWNKLQGYARAQRSSSGGNVDPIKVNLVFDELLLSNELRIGNGHLQTDFKIAENGFFKFDTSNDMLGNTFKVTNNVTKDSLELNAGTISADNFEAGWTLDTAGDQIEIEELDLSGSLNLLKNFNISIDLEGKNVNFDGSWAIGEEGNFEVDFYQDENVLLDFDLSNDSKDIELKGYVELDKDLHFDMSWKWKQGEWGDHAYFKINENTNKANLKEINFYFTYTDNWGANITLYNTGIYVCIEWCWYNGKLYTWPVIKVFGTLDFWIKLDWLTNYKWFEVV